MQTKTEELKVTKDMTIGEAIQQYPSIIEPLMNAGVHCVGCGASYFETLEEGLKGHGMTDSQVDKIIDDLNKALPEELGNPKEFTITTKAAEMLKDILKKSKNEGKGLRIAVIPGGCSGMQYDFSIEDKEKKDDHVIAIEETKFYIDKESMNMLKGAKLDYVDTLSGAGFKIYNPNATKTCGCGSSFG
jgi:iron-sulfur cluster assembly accessory protein